MLEQLNAYTGALLLFCGALLILGCALLCMLLVRQRRQQERMRDQTERNVDRITDCVAQGRQQLSDQTANAFATLEDRLRGEMARQQAASAAAMAERFRSRLLAPRVDAASAALVVPYDQVAGLSPKVLIISGFVNGFIPCREYFDSAEMPLDKQEKEHAKDARRVYAMAGKASKQLVVSRFTTSCLETAGVMKLHIGRIRLQDGKRMCAIEPSNFTEQLA